MGGCELALGLGEEGDDDKGVVWRVSHFEAITA
jgi:hypothetical protein